MAQDTSAQKLINKIGIAPAPKYKKVMGGWDFPIIILYKESLLSTSTSAQYRELKRFEFNNFDQESIKWNWLEEKSDVILRGGNIKRYREGFRVVVEIGFHALQQLDTTLDQFLVDMHNADKIAVIPHKDIPYNKFDVVIDNDFDYEYWLGKPYLGWQGVIKLKGIKRYSEIQMSKFISAL